MPADRLEAAYRAYSHIAPLCRGAIASQSLRPNDIQEKTAADFHTELDHKIESGIAQILLNSFPDDGILGEEHTSHNIGASMVWHVDPIDGTTNLLSGRPEIAVSIACYDSHDCIAAFIGFPTRDITVAWAAGQELYVNRNAWSMPRPPELLQDAVVGFPGDIRKGRHKTQIVDSIEVFADRCRCIRASGALAYDLATIALGELDVRYSFECKTVDFAAGAQLVQQVGGTVTDVSGNPLTLESTSILAACTKSLHAAALTTLSQGMRHAD